MKEQNLIIATKKIIFLQIINFTKIKKIMKKKISTKYNSLNFNEINNKKIDEDEEGEKKVTD